MKSTTSSPNTPTTIINGNITVNVHSGWRKQVGSERSTELPSPAVLRQLIAYDPNTGHLTWLERCAEWFGGNDIAARRWNSRNAGKEALTAGNDRGQRQGAVFGVPVRAARVAYALHYGRWPVGNVSLLNGDQNDLRAENLAVGHRVLSNNTSGVPGVSRYKADGRWQAHIEINGKARNLGLFDTIEAAAAARRAAELGQYVAKAVEA